MHDPEWLVPLFALILSIPFIVLGYIVIGSIFHGISTIGKGQVYNGLPFLRLGWMLGLGVIVKGLFATKTAAHGITIAKVVSLPIATKATVPIVKIIGAHNIITPIAGTVIKQSTSGPAWVIRKM
jgi:hypothetical protein